MRVPSSTAQKGGGRRTRPAAEARDYRRRKTCRVCRSPKIAEFLSFGPMPLANAFRAERDAPERRYNLSVSYCPSCGLVQVPDVVNPQRLFGTYNYFTSASWPMVEHFRKAAEAIYKQYLSDGNNLICEIGSNDGVFLQNLVGKCRVIGIDPAKNIALTAALKGVPTVTGFFSPKIAKNVRDMFGAPKVIFAANCFAHVDSLDELMEGVNFLLADDGVLIFENHRFAHMLKTACFDQIYHEHLAYYTLRPLETLMGRFGMRIIEARTIATHGQSFQIHAARQHSALPALPSVECIRREEDAMRLDEPETYQGFARDVAAVKSNLVELLRDLKAKGHSVAGYGAPAKGVTLLNYCQIGNDTLDYIVDFTVIKQGRYMPGTTIPIRHPDILKDRAPDYLLLLAWNYADAILS